MQAHISFRQVSELHLDERFNSGKEVLGKHLATGQKKVSSAFNNLWADIEVMREAQRKKQEERRISARNAGSASSPVTPTGPSKKPSLKCRFIIKRIFVLTSANAEETPSLVPRTPDLSSAQATVSAASIRATAYLSSWASWANEKRRGGGGGGGGNSANHDETGDNLTLTRVHTSPLPPTSSIDMIRGENVSSSGGSGSGVGVTKTSQPPKVTTTTRQEEKLENDATAAADNGGESEGNEERSVVPVKERQEVVKI